MGINQSTKQLPEKFNAKPQTQIVMSCFWRSQNVGCSQNHEEISFYSKTLDQQKNTFKFIDGCGFTECVTQNTLSGSQICFDGKFNNGNFEGLQLQKLDIKIWKKVIGQKVKLELQDEIMVGKTILKIRKTLKYSQIVEEDSVKRLNLPICKDSQAECRFCLQKCSEQSNPLVVPCRCTGSSGGVHQKCLSYWIFSNHGSFNKQMQSFSFRVERRQCQICKYSFQSFIDSRMLSVMAKDQANYIIFEKMNEDQANDFIICKFNNSNNNKITIGKQKSCLLSFVDSSMSNLNSIITCQDDEIFIQDKESKFGTYVGTTNNFFRLNESYCIQNLYFTLCKKVIKKAK